MATEVAVSTPNRHIGMHADPVAKAATLRRGNDAMRTRIASLKSAIHSERMRNQETHREKVNEIRELRDFAELEKTRDLEEQKTILLEEKSREIKTLQSKLAKDKEREIKQLMKRRDQEEAERRHRLELEREEAEKALSKKIRAETVDEVSDRMGRDNDKLRRIIVDLTDQKNKLEKLYMHKSQADAEKAEQIRRMHEEHDKIKQGLLREGRQEMQAEIQKRRDAENEVKKLEVEVSRLSRAMNIAESEKNEVLEDLNRVKTADSWSRRSPTKAPPSIGDPKTFTPTSSMRGKVSTPGSSYMTQEKKLMKQKVDMDRTIRDLNTKIASLNLENKKLRQNLETASAVPAATASRGDGLAKDNSRLQTLARRQSTKTNQLEKQLADVQEKYTAANQELSRAKSALVKSGQRNVSRVPRSGMSSDEEKKMNARLQTEEKKSQSLQAHLSETVAVVEKLKKDLKNHKMEIKSLKDDNTELQAKGSTSSHDEANAQITQLNVEKLRVDRAQARLRHQLETDRSAYENKLKSTQAGQADLEKKCEELASTLKAVETNVVEKDDKMTDVAADVESFQATIVNLEEQIATLEAELAALRSVQSEGGTTEALLQQEKAQLMKDIQGVRTELDNQKQQGSLVVDEKAALALKVAEAQTKIDELELLIAESAKAVPTPQPVEEVPVVKVEPVKEEPVAVTVVPTPAAIEDLSEPVVLTSPVVEEVPVPEPVVEEPAVVEPVVKPDPVVEEVVEEVAAPVEAAPKVVKKGSDAAAEAKKRREEKKRQKELLLQQQTPDKSELEKAFELKEQQRKEEEAKEEAEAKANAKAAEEEETVRVAAELEAAKVKAAAEQKAAADKAAADKQAADEAAVRKAAEVEAAKKKAEQLAMEQAAKQEEEEAKLKAQQELAEQAEQQALQEKQELVEQAEQKALQEQAEQEQQQQEADEQLADHVYTLTPQRYTVLYDYNPEDSSPNDDMVDEELTLVAGREVLIFGEADDDGFFAGQHLPEFGGSKGSVPSNFVELKTNAPEESPAELLDEGGERRRTFVALFDYEPDDQEDADAEEDLPLVAGQKIIVIGEQQEDGFMYAETIDGSNAGLVPSNFVEEVGAGAVEDFEYASDDVEDDVPIFELGSIVKALYDYHPEDLSPNDDPDEELHFKEGERFKIMQEKDDDGFYVAEHLGTGSVGLVPGNFIEGDEGSIPTGSQFRSVQNALA
eukprot:m.139633 g.139633  ORF g.139633 m.139633 type:complete len:1207 (-) comp30071_c2_seq1:491-4111(-)